MFKMTSKWPWAMYNYTNEEKNSYKIREYTKFMCEKLEIPETIVNETCDFVLESLHALKKHTGSKRAKVKDGIILTCINYVCKNNGLYLKYKDLAKLADIDIKYIYNGEKIMNEFINTKRINSNIDITKNSFETLLGIIKSKKIKIDKEILEKTEELINACEMEDSLSDHYKTSIALACLYATMCEYETIDSYEFCKIFEISNVTLNKVVSKLLKIN